MTQAVRSADGTRIAFETVGAGPPLVLVSGAAGYRAISPSQRELAELLGARFTVLTYDRRGRGESGDADSYAPAREVEDLRALVEGAGGSAVAMGLSSGAVLVLDAAQAGVPLVKLALYDAPFIVDDSRPPVPDEYVSTLNELVAAGRRGDAGEYFLTRAVGVPADAVASMRADAGWCVVEGVAHTFAYDGEIMGDTTSGWPLPPDRWDSVSAPTLVVDGGESPAHMHTGADAIARLLPNARRVTLPGQDHSAEPAVLAPVLLEFFAD